MTDLNIDTVSRWQGQTMIDPNGDKIGTIQQLYLDEATGKPEWAAVKTGLFGTRSTLVPLAQARQEGGGEIRVPHEKATIKDAPNFDTDQELSEDEERELYGYYGLDYSMAPSPSGLREGAAGPSVAERTREAGRGGTDDAMTRSEEELAVGKRERERGRARLRKYVVTEQVSQTIPVQREEVRVEREPITDENIDKAMQGPDITESEHEETLLEEEPVVEKRTVPKERVRLAKDTTTDEREVSEEVRKERIDEDLDEGELPR